MFQTSNHARINLPFLDKENSAWAYVELLINSCWLFADCFVIEDKVKVSSTYIFASPKQLRLLQESEDVEIAAIYLISPPQINFSINWKMEVIDRISTGIAFINDCKTYIDIYELSNGNKYFSQDPNEIIGPIEDAEVLFQNI